MNTTTQKVLKILKNKNLIILIVFIIFIILFIYISNTNSKFIKRRFYYVNYNKKIEYEIQYIPRDYSFNKIFYYYFSGGRNRKKFPLYFIDSKFIDRYYIKDDTLCISLNNSGYIEFKKIPEDIIEKISKAVLLTFNKTKKKSLDNLSIIYNTYMELYKYTLNK